MFSIGARSCVLLVCILNGCAPTHVPAPPAPANQIKSSTLEQPDRSEKKRYSLTKTSIPALLSGEQTPMEPEELGSELEDGAKKWATSAGLGKTITNIGAIIVFPPYALYLFGNAGLELFGKSPLYVTDILPESPRSVVRGAYNEVTSVPGRVIAGATGETFHEDW